MEKVKYKGKIIEVVEVEKTIPNTNKTKIFEYARRSPGVRAIIVNGKKILLSKEFRYEINDYDYRLPGGKVFDLLEVYNNCNKSNMVDYAKDAIIKECKEEVGIDVETPKLLYISKAGATIEWDLYYFEVTKFAISKQQLEEGEIIEYNWYTFNEVKNIILSNKMNEDRSVGVLLKYILKNKI